MDNQNNHRKLLGKLLFSGELEVLTGLHIGASKENLEIGSLDAPVVRDPITNEPYIPGSSLKGKLRTLLEKTSPDCSPNREGGTGGNQVRRHECNDSTSAQICPVCRLFGATGRQDNSHYPARIKVRDLQLTKESKNELDRIDTGLQYTEWKFENALDRITSAANPRNLERIPKGAKLEFSIVYDVEETQTLEEDIKNLNLAASLLQDDALGGHGSRGYGQVKFEWKNIEGRLVSHYKGDGGKILKFPSIEELLKQENMNKFVAFFKEAEKELFETTGEKAKSESGHKSEEEAA